MNSLGMRGRLRILPEKNIRLTGDSVTTLNIITAETSQDGTKVIITYDGTPDDRTYDINIMIDGVTDGNLASQIIGNSIEWVVLNTINSGEVVTVNIMSQGNISQVNDYPIDNKSIIVFKALWIDETGELISVIDGRTAIHGAHIALEFDGVITGVVTHEEFTLVANGSPRSLTGVNAFNDSIELTLSPPIESGNNVYLYYENDGNNNIDSFVDLIIDNTVPAPAPTPEIDLDSDGLPDEVIYDNPPVMIAEDDDSYQADFDGDGVEDIHIDKG